MLVALAALLAFPPHAAVIEAREIREDTPKYRIALRYPELPDASTFHAAVGQILTPLVENFRRYFREGPIAGPPETLTGDLSGDFTATVLKTGVVSVLMRWEVYVPGAAHPGNGSASVNYDNRKGRVLALADLFRPGVDFIPRLSELAIAALLKKEYADPDWVRRGAGPDEANFNVFTLTDTSLTLHFQTYQVAAGAAGPQEVEIPLTALRGLLRK